MHSIALGESSPRPTRLEVVCGEPRGQPKAEGADQRIMECFGLKGTFRAHLAQSPAVSRDIFK